MKGEPRINEQGRRLTGLVISDKMDKTIVVLIRRRVRHPIYKKYIFRSTRLHAHDEQNQCSIGDRVTIGETRPLSRKKSWALVRIEERAIVQEAEGAAS